MKQIILLFSLLFLSVFSVGTARSADDILFNDFESDSYGSWKAEGEAFGPGPAVGTFPRQGKVTGYLGNLLINTYRPSDISTGKLTSPSFKIERKYISFLLGGGGHSGTHIDLMVNGKIVRTATGPNIVSGGVERLEWFSWDVSELAGQTAVIQIVDQEKGGWGHINIDHILFTDTRREVISKSRSITMEKRYLHLPVKTGHRETWLKVMADNKPVREFIIELADSDKDADFHATLDLSDWKGQKLELVAEKVMAENNGLDAIVQSDELADKDSAYREKYRPQFHFSPRRGWTNDPNGLVFYKGTWHLFYQHNPFGVRWNNMTWGHATSPDLFHWTEGVDAIYPNELGTVFSGSAVVDWKNTSGFQKGSDPPLIALYTSNGGSMRYGNPASQSLAWSADAGKTWIRYEKNPVLPHMIGGNRDPKVFRYEPTGKWIMALYLDKEDYALFQSNDLKTWDKICDIKNLGCSECPDMFELPVDGNSSNKKWVFWGGNGKYLIGTFDGKTFTRESEPLPMKWGGNDYAAQSYSDTPGRRIQFSWMNGGTYPGMPFNQQFSVPRELTLRTTKDGIRLCTNPVKELDLLRSTTVSTSAKALGDGLELPIADNELLDVQMKILPGNAEKISLNLRDHSILLFPKENRMEVEGIKAPLFNEKETIDLRIVLDRMSIELFANGGLSQVAKCFVPVDDKKYDRISFEVKGTGAMLQKMEVSTLKSVWGK